MKSGGLRVWCFTLDDINFSPLDFVPVIDLSLFQCLQ